MKNPYRVPDVVRILVDAVGEKDWPDEESDKTIKAGEEGAVIDVLSDTHIMVEFCKDAYDSRIAIVNIKDIEMVDQWSKKI